MTEYDDATRGQFQMEDCAKQLVLFDGMRFYGRTGHMNVTPTDIDGLVQLEAENCIIIFELKHSGLVPKGQADALKRLADAIQAGGVNCAVLVAIHGTPANKPIIAKDAIVKLYYYNGKWTGLNGEWTLYQTANEFIKHIRKEKAI